MHVATARARSIQDRFRRVHYLLDLLLSLAAGLAMALIPVQTYRTSL
ncbi:MAG: hypothetical protein N838_27265 [Thiohalocapsa sp. PB-PSB1]|nr:MAG: hypothetical protein N838_11790 [Thiohalocapsa sp. PB-PSB1]QQO56515.1 MAG: hypothetical protein N838_27265 [Thiohalocapsa sp. PB-PSB1]